MSHPIYSGLTDEQAIKLMDATVQCNHELPRLEQWSKQKHCAAGAAIAILAFALTYMLATNANASEFIHLGVSIAVAGLVLLVTWVTARKTERRRESMRALHQGLIQIKKAAESSPGACAAELVNAMPH